MEVTVYGSSADKGLTTFHALTNKVPLLSREKNILNKLSFKCNKTRHCDDKMIEVEVTLGALRQLECRAVWKKGVVCLDQSLEHH